MNKRSVFLGLIGISLWCSANHPPRAHSQVLYVQPGGAVAIVLWAEDPDGDPLTFEIVALPQTGKLLGNPPCLRYLANPNFAGRDRFSFRVHDPHNGFDLGAVELVVSQAAATLRIVPSQPQDLPLSTLMEFLVQNGVRTWYVVDLGRPWTVAGGPAPFVFAGGDSPRFFLLDLEDQRIFPVPKAFGFLDLRAVAPGKYLLFVLAGTAAYSIPIYVALPGPDRKLVYGG